MEDQDLAGRGGADEGDVGVRPLQEREGLAGTEGGAESNTGGEHHAAKKKYYCSPPLKSYHLTPSRIDNCDQEKTLTTFRGPPGGGVQ